MPVRDIKKIALKYLHDNLIIDLIPIIPYELIFEFNHSRLFFMIKCIRIQKSLHFLDVKTFTKNVKSYFHTDTGTVNMFACASWIRQPKFGSPKVRND